MAQNKRFGGFSSSVNPEQLSATVSGAILAFSALLVMVGGWLGVPLLDSDIAEFAKQAGLAVGALWAVWGLVRKFIVRISETRD